VRLAATAWGDPAHPVVVLVHGYPDNSHVWHGVAQALAGRFRVVAYDVRGAGASDVPADMADYRLERLADDFIAVVDAVSPDRPVHLVGHDWGSIQGWEFVTDPRLYGASPRSPPVPDLASITPPARCASRPGTGAPHCARRWHRGTSCSSIFPACQSGTGNSGWDVAGRSGCAGRKGSIPPPTRRRPPMASMACACTAPTQNRLRHPHNRHAHAPVQVIVPTRDRYVRPAVTEGVGRWAAQAWRRPVDAHHWFPLAAQLMAAMVCEFVDHLQGAPASPALQSARVTSEAVEIS
jgi:pimeloyl-ACP methyl ester carboxylesterase